MKKVFTLIVMTLALIACQPKTSLLEYAKQDYAQALVEAKDSTVQFLEVQTTLNKPITNLGKNKIEIVASRTVIKEGLKVKYIDRTFKKGKVVSVDTDYRYGFWIGDLKIEPNSVKLDFKDALKALKKSGKTLPESNKMTFRAPLQPPFEPQYLFGSVGTFVVAINANTGKVIE